MQPEVRIVLDHEVAAHFQLEDAYDSQAEAFTAIARDTAELSPKVFLDGDGSVPTVFAYGARASLRGAACVRVACVGGVENGRRGLPELDAVIVVTDADTGLLRAVIDGVQFTLIRTAAASAVAVAQLAREDACTLALFGSGPQADACATAIARVRPLRRIALWSPNADHRHAAVARIATTLDVPTLAATSPEDAVSDARIVVAVTNSFVPVVSGAAIEPGTLVIAMGSFRPDRCEVDDELMDRAATIVVDQREVALASAGPVMRWARRRGFHNGILQLGDVILGTPARTSDDDIVVFNSVGLGVQDAAAAAPLLAAIDAAGAGTTVAELRSR